MPLVVWVETYWVLTRAYRMTDVEVTRVLGLVLERDEVRAESPATIRAAIAATETSRAEFAEAVIAASAQVSGCSGVVTFDRRAAKDLGFELL